MSAVFDAYPPEMIEPNDIITLNDPWMGSGHLPDIYTIMPVFWGRTLLGFTVTVANHEDVGGAVAGSLTSSTTEVYQEGVRITPIKLYQRGELNHQLLVMIASNSRTPKKMIGDFDAQVSANRVGTRRLLELTDRLGPETIKRCFESIIISSERILLHKIINSIPEGEYYDEVHWDDGSRTKPPTRIKVRLSMDGRKLTIDYAGSDDAKPDCSLNNVYNHTLSYSVYTVKALMNDASPVNAGIYKPVEVLAPEGSIMNALPPVAVSMHGIFGSYIIKVVTGAIRKAAPKLTPACFGMMQYLKIGGLNKRTGVRGVESWAIQGGAGASITKDGESAISWSGNPAAQAAEYVEVELPLRVLRWALTNSGGVGMHRGGCGVRMDVEILDDSFANMILRGDGYKIPACGVSGGGPGAPAAAVLLTGRRRVWLPSKTSRILKKGNIISIRSGGGGGAGSPNRREKVEVLRDIANGYLTPREASTFYSRRLGG